MPKDRPEVKNNQDGGVEKSSGPNEAYCTRDETSLRVRMLSY